MLKLEECTNRVKASANVEGGGTSGVESVWLEISYLSPTREIYINDMSYDPCGKKGDSINHIGLMLLSHEEGHYPELTMEWQLKIKEVELGC